MKYEIKILKKAQKSLSKIQEPFQTNIIDAISTINHQSHIQIKKIN